MNAQRFPRAARLLTPAQFDPVFKTGSRIQSAHFRAHVLSSAAGSARLGITIAKRNVASSVDRNRIRRQIREAYRLRRPSLDGFDIVVIAKGGIAGHANDVIRQDLVQLLTRIAALKRAPPPGTIAA